MFRFAVQCSVSRGFGMPVNPGSGKINLLIAPGTFVNFSFFFQFFFSAYLDLALSLT